MIEAVLDLLKTLAAARRAQIIAATCLALCALLVMLKLTIFPGLPLCVATAPLWAPVLALTLFIALCIAIAFVVTGDDK